MIPKKLGSTWSATLARRFRGALLPASAVFIAALLSPAPVDAGEPLARVRYRVGDREATGIGELILDSTTQMKLRLFADSIAAEYSLYLSSDDLLEVEYLGAAETESELSRREEIRRQAEARRAALAADAARRRAVQPEPKPSAAKTTKSATAAKSKKEKGSEARATGARPPRKGEVAVASIEETMRELAAAIDLLRARLTTVTDCNDKLLDAVRAIQAAGSRREAHRWLDELEGLKAELKSVSEMLERRVGDVEQLRATIEEGEATRREVRDEADVVLRLLIPVESKLAKAEAKCETHKTVLEAMPAAGAEVRAMAPLPEEIKAHAKGGAATSPAAATSSRSNWKARRAALAVAPSPEPAAAVASAEPAGDPTRRDGTSMTATSFVVLEAEGSHPSSEPAPTSDDLRAEPASATPAGEDAPSSYGYMLFAMLGVAALFVTAVISKLRPPRDPLAASD